MAKKVMRKLKEEVEEKTYNCRSNEGQSKMIASCDYLENCVNVVRRNEVVLADSVETLGVDLRTKVKRLGAKEKARRKIAGQDSRSSRRTKSSKVLHEGRSEEVV